MTQEEADNRAANAIRYIKAWQESPDTPENTPDLYGLTINAIYESSDKDMIEAAIDATPNCSMSEANDAMDAMEVWLVAHGYPISPLREGA